MAKEPVEGSRQRTNRHSSSRAPSSNPTSLQRLEGKPLPHATHGSGGTRWQRNEFWSRAAWFCSQIHDFQKRRHEAQRQGQVVGWMDEEGMRFVFTAHNPTGQLLRIPFCRRGS